MRRSETDVIVTQTPQPGPATDRASTGPTIYFDGACPICSAEIGHYASRKGGERLNFVDVSDEDSELGAGLAPCDAKRRFHVRLADGTLVSGARAFVAVWNALPGWQWAAHLARIPGATPLLEVTYRIFLRVRPALARLAGYFGARATNPQSSRQ